MKSLISLILSFLFAFWMHPDSLLAQHTRIIIDNELRKLDESLSFANELVLAFGNRQARQAIREAKKSMDKAIEQFRLNRLNRSRFFINQSYRSITFAMKITLKLAGGSLLDRLRDLIGQVEQVVEGCENKEAERLLKKAKKNQQMAIRAYKNQMVRETFEYYRIGTFLVKRALNLCDNKNKNLSDQFFEEKERFHQLLQKAENLLKENPSEKAVLLIQQARKQALQTQHAYNRGKYKQSLEHYYKATRLLLRAIEICEFQNMLPRDRIESKAQNELTLLGELLESTEEKIAESKNVRAKLLFHRAQRLRKEAQIAFNAGRFRISIRKSKMARNALDRTFQILKLNEPGLDVRVENEIDKLNNDLKNVEEMVRNSENSEAVKCIELSKGFLNKSIQAFEGKNYYLALEGILLANRLMNLGEKLARSKEKGSIDKKKIEMRLREFDELILNTSQDIQSSDNPVAKNLLKQAQNLYEESKSALQENKLVFAKNILEVAFIVHQRSMTLIK